MALLALAGAIAAISLASRDGQAEHVAATGSDDPTTAPTLAPSSASSTTMGATSSGSATTIHPASEAGASNEATDAATGEPRGHSQTSPPDRDDPVGSFVVSCSKSALTAESDAIVDIPCSVRSVDGFQGSVSLECDYPPQEQHCFPPDSIFVDADKTTAFTFRFKNGNNDASTWGFPLVLSGRSWPLRSDFTINVNVRRTQLESCSGRSIGPAGLGCTLRWDPNHMNTASLDLVESSPEFTCTVSGSSEGQSTVGSVTPKGDGTASIALSCNGPHAPNAPVTLRVTVDGHTDSFHFTFA